MKIIKYHRAEDYLWAIVELNGTRVHLHCMEENGEPIVSVDETLPAGELDNLEHQMGQLYQMLDPEDMIICRRYEAV